LNDIVASQDQQHTHAHALPRFDDGKTTTTTTTTTAYQPAASLLNTPAPNVPLVSPLQIYSASGHQHQSHQSRVPPLAKVFHQRSSSPPFVAVGSNSSSLSLSSNYNDGGDSIPIPHLPPLPLAAAAAATSTTHATSPITSFSTTTTRGLSYILNPTEEVENQPNPNMDVEPITVSDRGVGPFFLLRRFMSTSILNCPVFQNISRPHGTNVGRKDESFLNYFPQFPTSTVSPHTLSSSSIKSSPLSLNPDPSPVHSLHQQFDGPTSNIDTRSMASAPAPNRANAASTGGVGTYPFVQQRGDALIEQGMSVSTCARVILALECAAPHFDFPFLRIENSFSFH
jgi:hypothetical protein